MEEEDSNNSSSSNNNSNSNNNNNRQQLPMGDGADTAADTRRRLRPSTPGLWGVLLPLQHRVQPPRVVQGRRQARRQ